MASLIPKAVLQSFGSVEVTGASERVGRTIAETAKREAKSTPRTLAPVFTADRAAFKPKTAVPTAEVLTAVESVHDTTLTRAPYRNVETVDVGRPLTPKQAMDYLMSGTATGKRGLARDFHATTPEAAQHPGGDPNRLHAEGALLDTGLPIPGALGGIMDGYRDSATAMHINMVDHDLGFALQAKIGIAKGAAPHLLVVTEEGVAEGDVPGVASAISLGHMKFFSAGDRIAQGANEAAGMSGAAAAVVAEKTVGFDGAIAESAEQGTVSLGRKLFVAGTVLDLTGVGAIAGVPLQMAGATIAVTSKAAELMGRLASWATSSA